MGLEFPADKVMHCYWLSFVALCRACAPASERIERCWQMKTHCAWSSHSVGGVFNIDTHQLCPTLRMECHYPPAALVCVCVFAAPLALAENTMLTGLALMRLCCDPARVPSSAHDRPASGDQQPPSLTIPRPCNNART